MQQPVNVLIVEDENDSRRALGDVLRARGYRVGLAESAEQALEQLDGNDTPFAILIDIDLPGMSGLELLSRLESDGCKAIPVIVSAVDGERVRSATDRGVQFVRKPIDINELLQALRRALQQHR